MKAAILAIGTELTTGQITNRNATWLSERLDEKGAQVVMHLTVADDRPAILRALDLIAESAELLLVTGGLGPTSDDFTREVVAHWAEAPLTWHEPSWTKIQTRLDSLGIRVAQSNRQQCYFPSGAEVISNSEGTADAFYLKKQRSSGIKHVWVLPGPPREIDAVWKSAISTQLDTLIPSPERKELLLWQLLGKSEAEVGEITEATLAGTGLATGYRAHRPYVEVKVWAPLADTRSPAVHQALGALDLALKPWTVARGKPEFGRKLWARLADFEDVLVIDQLTQGILAESLFPLIRSQKSETLAEQEFVIHSSSQVDFASSSDHEATVRGQLAAMDPETVGLVIAGMDPAGGFTLGLCHSGHLRVESLQGPWKPRAAGDTLRDRAQRFAAETALRLWAEWLNAAAPKPH